MEVHIRAATEFDKSTLTNLFQLYTYDFSELMALDVDDRGRFEARSFDAYWQDPWRYPFLIHIRQRLAGFALVHHRSRLSGDPTRWDVAEFFVLRRYRRQQIGARAATLLFDRFRGKWEVRQVSANVSATAFWRKVIDRYTGGAFEETLRDDEVWRGPVQTFDNSDRASAPEA
jgi:predicted acetyltransferase